MSEKQMKRPDRAGGNGRQGHTNEKAKQLYLSYNDSFIAFFKKRAVLAAILINVVPEYSELSYNDVYDAIIAENPDSEDAKLLAETNVDMGSKVILDLRFDTWIKSSESQQIQLLVDLEMQRKFHPGYPLLSRAIYYTSRLIGAQKVNQDYSNVRPVHSIWICVKGIPERLQNKVVSFNLEPSSIDIDKRELVLNFPEIHLFAIDLILLSEQADYAALKNAPPVVRFLQAVFHGEIGNSDVNPYTEQTGGLAMEAQNMITFEKQLDAMFDAWEKEMEEKGIEKGFEKGIEKGIEKSAQAVAKRFNISVEEARIIINQA